MSTEKTLKSMRHEPERDHSAFAEFRHDERRHAVLLLSALVLAAVFFAFGIMVGRWTNQSPSTKAQSSLNNPPTIPTPSQSLDASPSVQPSPTPQISPTPQQAPDSAHRFAVLIPTHKMTEVTDPLINTLKAAGYPDIRTATPTADASHSRPAILIGHFTRDEARQVAARLHSTGDPQFRHARLVAENQNRPR